jgi:phosphate:Na+ symporter
MYATKSMKDSHADIQQLRNSSNDIKYQFYIETKKKITAFLDDIDKLLSSQTKTAYFEQLSNIYSNLQNGYSQTLQKLYKEISYIHLDEMELSTIINFNREIFTSLNALLTGTKDYLLDTKEAAVFDSNYKFIK